MAFSDWVKETKARIGRDGIHGVKQSTLELGKGGIRRIESKLPTEEPIASHLDRRYPRGTPIYEREWDVLVILDACRADLMAEVEGEYSFVDSHSTNSVAGGSRSWMLRNFAEQYRDETEQTSYVTGNPFSEEVLESGWFNNLEEVWKYAWDESLNTIPAGAITDVAIHESRQQCPQKMIVHYMQPHHPFIPNPMDPGMNKSDLSSPADPIWQKVKRGEVNRNEVWEAYRENLHYVLEEVGVLLENIDSDSVVISADHGNAVGEWGFFGHGDIPIAAVREVPWCETSARDGRTRHPELSEYDRSSDEPATDRNQLLKDLGYL